MKQLFILRREERWPALVLVLALLSLHVLMISKFQILFADFGEDSWRTFMRNFRMSGYDPITYDVVTRWHLGYNVVRHPLLAYYMYVPYLVNQALWTVTGCNCVQWVVAAILLFCSFYSMVFLYRLMRSAVGVGRGTACLLTAYFMGFAHIMVATVVPDHFCLSLFAILLTLTLLQPGKAQENGIGRLAGRWRVPLLIVLTGGITLTNAVIVVLAVWVQRGRSFFRPRFFLGSIVAPCLLMLSVGIGQRLLTDDSQTSALSPVREQMAWMRQNVSRSDIVVENLLGESLQLHRRHVLGDVLCRRPVIVRYSWPAQYAVEAIIVILFLWGVWTGRREPFMWQLMAIFGFTLLLHVGLGFALDEVHIMTCHWAFVIPLSTAWLLCPSAPCRRPLSWILLAVTLYLWVYHGLLLYRYLTWPLAR